MKFLQASLVLLAFGIFSGCAPVSDDSLLNPPTLSMGLPDSITGGKAQVQLNLKPGISARALDVDVPCSFLGSEDPDPFRNGYEASKFLVSHMAAWTCISDLVMELVDFTINDGRIHATDNVKDSANYNVDDPTHYQVVRVSDNSSKVRLFYGFSLENPPEDESKAGFVLSWQLLENNEIDGVLSVDVREMDKTPNLEDPIALRLAFSQTNEQNINDMFLIFDETHEYNNGMRVKITKDNTALPGESVYTVQALVDMKKQWLDVPSIDEIPNVALYTVSNKVGEGASRALITDLAVALPLAENNHLGDYLFDKTDNYYFSANINQANWDWVEKYVSKSAYRASRTTPATGGSWLPFNPSLDLLIAAFELDSNYFSNGVCESVGDECDDLLNAIFKDGFAGQEPNQGADPNDWRSLAMENVVYLDTVYPNGVNWDGALQY